MADNAASNNADPATGQHVAVFIGWSVLSCWVQHTSYKNMPHNQEEECKSAIKEEDKGAVAIQWSSLHQQDYSKLYSTSSISD